MRTFAMAIAVALLLGSSAWAADRDVKKSTLEQMNLGGMQQLSDDDAHAVRGKGTFAGVWGSSTASWMGGQTSTNSYAAGSNWLGRSAGSLGGSLSFSGRTGFGFR
jgi:hypothetical protein